jgi:hypothetical protein
MVKIIQIDHSEISIHRFRLGRGSEKECWIRENDSGGDLYIYILFIYLFKSWATQNFITIKTSWNTND